MPGFLGKYGGSALKYWGSILASAYQRLNTADMWTAIRVSQQNYGLDRPGTTAPDVSVIRSYANRIVAGAQQLAAAADSDSITSGMMAIAPYTDRSLNSIAVAPSYQVRSQVTVRAEDGTVSQYTRFDAFTAAEFPDTVGALRDAVTANAVDSSRFATGETNTLPGTVVGVANFEISVV